MIIDSHQHFWNYDPKRDLWIDESMEVIRKNFLPKDKNKITTVQIIAQTVTAKK